ncbi:ribose-phosphate pyrophosphokinase [Candidatus Babeliales bacterium]|nr:ribose-phosphate pyrophosphokinase [Candidatus Babeliales bacterium]
MPEIVTYTRKGQKKSFLSLILEKKLNKKSLIFELNHFSDSETNLQFFDSNKVLNKEVLLVWQFFYDSKEQINSQLFDLLFVVLSLKEFGVVSISVLLPYLPYLRQEDSDVGLDIGLVKPFLQILKKSGIGEITAVEIHDRAIVDILPIKIKEIKIAEFWASHIKNSIKNYKDIILASPDKGGRFRVDEVAKLLGLETAYVKKERFGADQTRVLSLDGNVENKTVFLLDDILDTAGTAINACNMLLENGAKSVFGGFTHGIFSGDACKKIEKSGFTEIFVTNTVFFDITDSKKIISVLIDDFLVQNLVLE